jgi:DNA polymerase IV
MPMFQARRLCPHAVIIPPDMDKYVRVGREVRQLMRELTPLLEPLSIDEAFMDLGGTARLHGLSPAQSLARFATRVATAIGITVSIGLSINKFLAKIASDLDKPRGFAVLGGKEAQRFLAPKPVTFIWSVGTVMQARLARDGITLIAHLAATSEAELKRRYGAEWVRLSRLARGLDSRAVIPERKAKSLSAETTFEEDIAAFLPLERRLWLLREKLSGRLKAADLAGSTVTLKLKRADFKLRTRGRALSDPTHLAAKIFATARALSRPEADGTKFRLIGIAVSQLVDATRADPGDLLDERGVRAAAAEHALDQVRAKFGRAAVVRGLAFDTQTEG